MTLISVNTQSGTFSEILPYYLLQIRIFRLVDNGTKNVYFDINGRKRKNGKN